MKAEGWAVVTPDRKLLADTIRATAAASRRYFVQRSGFETFAKPYRLGYRCVPVTIEGRSQP